MSPIEALVEKLTPDQRELLARLLGAPAASVDREPIAVVGLSCRFPGGAESPEAFWDLLIEGRDAISEIPQGRFPLDDFYDPTPATPGKMSTKWGGFLEDLEGFDARFFGISPREAADMDPQQRLLLEVAQEALEDAGLLGQDLAGSATGVFVGTHSHDYSWLQFRDPRKLRSYASTGTANSIVANRLSYLLDLRGPSLAVDTACSSSLVALHLACRSLGSGDCRVALAAGVNVILSPHWGVAVSQLGMLSPDGRCRAFDAGANGFVRSEGCAVVALKRLSDAEADGDRIHAVVRGSFVNQDGRTNGITAPNGLSQQAVVRAALTDAGVAPEAVSYVETHGTGTALGDPIEVEALAAVLGGGEGETCVLGSVKSNLGHLEAAAGMAGFLKVVLALEKGTIPPQIHFDRLNPHISLSDTRFVIPRAPVAWPRSEARPRVAGVSSFGFGGTNAHVVLEEAPVSTEAPGSWPQERGHLLVLSARTDDALREAAARTESWLRSPSCPALADIGHTASLRRNHYERRLAVVGVDANDIARRLEAFVSGRRPEGLVAGGRPGRESSGSSEPKPVFVFSGQGPQWWAMGRELARCEPVFLSSLEQCDAILSRRARWSLLEELLRSAEGTSRVAATEIAQPALFALQVGLASLLASWGVEPSALLGHSLGEVAAAHVAGVLDLEQALQVVFERGRLMEAASGRGAMVSVELPLEEVEVLLAPFEGALEIAATNGPHTTVVSGDPQAAAKLLASLERESVATRRLPVDYAFHSSRMEPAARDLESSLSGLSVSSGLSGRRARLPFVSTVTGRWADGSELVASYWRDNVRERVRFYEAISLLVASGRRLFVEVGPHPVLASSIHGTLEARGIEGSVLPTLRRGRGESLSLLETLGALHVAGTRVDFSGLYGSRRSVVSLPPYPFQRERFPLPSQTSEGDPRLEAMEEGGDAHPLLGRRLAAPLPMFEARIDASESSLLAEHRRDGEALFPAAGYLSMALAASSKLFSRNGGAAVVEELVISRPLVVPDEGEGRLQWVGEPTGDRTRFRVFYSAPGAGESWVLTASGTLALEEPNPPPRVDVEEIRRRLTPLSSEEHYRRASAKGIGFGPRFHGVREIYRGRGEVLARVDVPPEVEAEASRYGDHPALLDAWIQPIQYALSDGEPLYLPIGCDRFVRYRTAGTSTWSHARLREPSNGSGREVVTFDLRVLDEAGAALAEVEGLRMKRVAERPETRVEPALFRVDWRELPKAGTSPEGPEGPEGPEEPEKDDEDVEWILVGGESAFIRDLEDALRSRSRSARHLRPEELAAAVRAVRAKRLGVVHLGSLEGLDGDVMESQRRLFEPILDLLRATPEIDEIETRLWLVTRGTERVGTETEPVHLASATLHGLCPTLALEQPELRPVTVDLDPGKREGEAEALAPLLRFELEESRLALRRGRVLAARLWPVAPVVENRELSSYRLAQGSAATLDDLHLEPLDPRLPGPGEVEIEIECTGLNFRDVLAALDLYPGKVGAPGNECAGRVMAVGEGVEGWSIGDRAVAALVPGSFASHLVAPVEHVVPLPETLSFRDGAASSIAFLTARYGLERRARLRAGERVLVHAAAGGVGMAAVQIALRAGAEVFATAGSEEKRVRLRSMGIRHVFDSRRLDFVEGVLAATKREGVDVVLNSLSGDFIEASLSLLRPGGRFVEIGKRGIWTGAEVASAREDVSYVVFDLEEVFRRDPKAMHAMLVDTFRELEAGRLEPLPTRSFSMAEVGSAFRYMAEARHVGKVVVDRWESSRTAGWVVDAEARYLVTGGLGAMGLAVAQWLSRNGARHLVLAGRRAPSQEAEGILEALRETGVEVTVVTADIERERDVLRVVASGETARPLKGIVHAAGALRDGVLCRQSFEDLEVALGPKVRGAWNLHRATLGTPLDFFVMLSSMASVIGSSGQAGYSAANAFVDALAQERRRLGLPGTSVSFGPFAETGMASREAGPERYRSRGIRKMTTEEGLALLERLLIPSAPAHALALPVDWERFARSLPSECSRSLVSELAPSAAPEKPDPTGSARSTPEGFVDRVRRAPSTKRRSMVAERVTDHVLSVLGLPEGSSFDPREGLRDAGLDSLMAVEVRNRLRADVPGLSLPTTLCFDFPTVEAVTGFLMKGLGLEHRNGGEPRPETASPRSPASPSNDDELRDLSEEEAEALLLQELEGRRPGR